MRQGGAVKVWRDRAGKASVYMLMNVQDTVIHQTGPLLDICHGRHLSSNYFISFNIDRLIYRIRTKRINAQR